MNKKEMGEAVERAHQKYVSHRGAYGLMILKDAVLIELGLK